MRFGTHSEITMHKYTQNKFRKCRILEIFTTHFSSTSSMNYHVDCIVAATCKTLAFIHHMLRKAIVRSKLEYASFI